LTQDNPQFNYCYFVPLCLYLVCFYIKKYADEKRCNRSVVCDVLAKSQASALLQNGWSKEEVLAIHSAALAHQAAMLVSVWELRAILQLRGVLLRMSEWCGGWRRNWGFNLPP
jgi:hypothetical protein